MARFCRVGKSGIRFFRPPSSEYKQDMTPKLVKKRDFRLANAPRVTGQAAAEHRPLDDVCVGEADADSTSAAGAASVETRSSPFVPCREHDRHD